MSTQRPENTPDSDASQATQRIAKAMARAGLCSRREAERWIEEGRVVVNDRKIDSPAVNVGPDDVVLVDDKPLPKQEPTRLWCYHKPVGLVTSARDEKGRATVFDNLPKSMPRVISIGRLDLNSEGLLLLTNDGELARKLELPQTGWKRKYRVRVRGRVDEAKLESLKAGITVEGVHYDRIDAELERQQGSNAWVAISLREGKNREIRRVMEHLGYSVNRLIRVSYGPFNLGTLARGETDEVTPGVIRDIMGNPHKGAKAKPRKNKPRRHKPKTAARKPGAKVQAKRSGPKKPQGKA
ncbi:pseudouridine synthase [Aestuariispira ectoiniformans]|uniref:pseudouridine synthase n=1 Tax=Aestuariispira ectoiniformans TaxID=2775080 RepID=UPI00223BA6A6|nr:rRNA pseudouridine synthase [Aestuariispira ectoiniformans]